MQAKEKFTWGTYRQNLRDFQLVSKHRKHYSSDFRFHRAVEEQIKLEIELGNYVVTKTKPIIISSIGAIEKSNGDVRIIHDASLPTVISLNSYTTDTSCSYMDLRHALKIIQRNDYLGKIDLKSAYRSVNSHDSDIPLTGLQWTFNGDNSPTYMYDAKLPFGHARSPKNFQQFSASVCEIMKYGETMEAKMLENSVVRLKSKGWASSTSGTYRTHHKTYLEFCENYDLKPLPCTTKIVELYIAFFVDVKNFALSSIRSYLNIISVLHKSHDKPDPIASCCHVRHLLTGVKQELGTSQNCKAPVTPEGFYFYFLRPNNVLVKGLFDPEINLRRVDVLPCSWGMLVTLKVTKTLQFRYKPI
ncbi:unnamed protein product [Mytilus edulis]|uniref:Reverse transcriptase n=1 Tax=Mytilus edulis TaxID=6550 RepID=A0A8S3V9G7_MYTED|nr:unnamed protein product [Mytilus edulis]